MVCSPVGQSQPEFACISAAVEWQNYASVPNAPPVLNEKIGVDINLLGRGPATSIKRVEAIYIDNTFNSLTVYVVFPDTGFCAVAQPYSIVMLPVLTQQLWAKAYCEGFDGLVAPSTRIVLMEKHVDVFEIAPSAAVVVVNPSVRSSSHGNNGAANTTTTTVNLPAGIVAGDELMICFTNNGTAPTITTPAGWTLKDTSTLAQAFAFPTAVRVFTRTADGAEGASVNIAHSAGISSYGCLAIKNAEAGPEGSLAKILATSTYPLSGFAPSWGTDTNVWIGILVVYGGGAQTITTPAGYTVDVTEDTGAAPVRQQMRIVTLVREATAMPAGNFTSLPNARDETAVCSYAYH